MRRELFHSLNIGIIVLFGLLFCTVQSVLFRTQFLSFLSLDLVLLLVLFIGLKRPIIEGTLLVVVIGHFAEVHSGAPAGMLMSCYLICYAATVLTREFFLMESGFSIILLGASGGILWKVSFLILAYLMDFLPNVWKTSILYVPPYLVALGLFTRPLFSLMLKIDRATGIEEPSELGLY